MANLLQCDGCGATAVQSDDALLGWVRLTLLSRLREFFKLHLEERDFCATCAERMLAALDATQTQRLPDRVEIELHPPLWTLARQGTHLVLTPQGRQGLTQILTALSAFAHISDRRRILQNLPAEVRDQITPSDVASVHIRNILAVLEEAGRITVPPWGEEWALVHLLYLLAAESGEARAAVAPFVVAVGRMERGTDEA